MQGFGHSLDTRRSTFEDLDTNVGLLLSWCH